MHYEEFKKIVKRTYVVLSLFFGLLLIIAGGLVYEMLYPSFLITETDQDIVYEPIENLEVIGKNDIKNGIHEPTGFVDANGLEQVVINCTPCHSAKLVTQNRATREGWIGIIRWMQETQNLWDLGANEAVIVDYLATHYAPENKGRRELLNNIEWYDLKDK
ncbi:monoheme cytochrome C [Snuella sedimenti]|uniref:Monoheme cytochrome C n=1 Tax=Snuella sedimenti TaxID=2798802 RepID=A0A8J7J3I2_9FLAO|nr:monoheme cytochrome C [Snuella sedimenti]MBJ6368249.1 monoheme cytochrome C [Snuella sedimenti]